MTGRRPATRASAFRARSIRRAGATTVALAALCVSAYADRVVTTDGRILTPQKARAEGDTYKLTFENGTIVAPKSLVASAEIEGDMSEYVPANDDERAKLAQGYVKYRGKWLSRAGYLDELRKASEASKKRTAELAAHSDWLNAWVTETEHFRVRSNTSPELLAYYAELMEAFYDLMDQRIGIDPSPSLKRMKMEVAIYKSHEEFLAIAKPGKASVLGFFSPMAKSLNLYHDYAEPSRSEWVALHECTHLLTFLIDPQYMPQIWLNEAVADYFGSSRISRDKKGKLKIEPGLLQLDRTLTVQQALRGEGSTTGATPVPAPAASDEPERPFTKLEDLFLLTRDQFDGFQYAHAWSFVYFLNTAQNGKYKKNFDRFFKGLYTLEKGIPFENVAGNAVPEAGGVGKLVAAKDIRAYLLSKLGVRDVPALEREWREYIGSIAITGVDAVLKRGLYAVADQRYEEALPDLDAAISGGTKDPRAWASRARALALTEQFEKSLADYETAIAMDPLSASFRWQHSRMMAGYLPVMIAPPTGASGASLDVDAEADEKIKDPAAKAEAGLACELAPDNDRFRAWYERFE